MATKHSGDVFKLNLVGRYQQLVLAPQFFLGGHFVHSKTPPYLCFGNGCTGPDKSATVCLVRMFYTRIFRS